MTHKARLQKDRDTVQSVIDQLAKLKVSNAKKLLLRLYVQDLEMQLTIARMIEEKFTPKEVQDLQGALLDSILKGVGIQKFTRADYEKQKKKKATK